MNNVCKVDSDKCTLGENELNLYNNDLEVIGTLVKTYISEFGYTDKHISLYNNQNYTVMVYKTARCINELSLEMPNVDFQSCYQKVQAAYNITQDLIISIAEKKDTSNPKTFFSFFHPVSGEKLNADEICQNDTIVVQENLNELLNKNDTFYEVQNYFAAQGINIFDKSDPFFTDICYDFDNPLKKDIPINDRVTYFFPNVSLCDEGCQYNGINLEDMTASCDCKFNDISNNALFKDNPIMDTMVGEIFDLISSSNLLVFKCFKYIFKHFSRSIGGWICLVLIIAQIAMVLLYFLLELPKLKIYLFSLTNRYISFISKKTRLESSTPPKRTIGNTKIINNMKQTKPNNEIIIFDKKKDFDTKSDKIKLTKNNKKDKKPLISLGNSVDNKIMPNKNKKEETESKNDKEFFKEYLETSPDEMEFDDAYVFDKRTFKELFTEDLKENQIVAHTFIANDPLKPRTMKIIVFILVVLLYFVVNGLLFSEEVITELFEVDEDKENFFSYFPRSIERIFYCTLVSIVIGIITDLFFVDETKIKGFFKRDKTQPKIMKEKVVAFINDIKKRNIAFIVIASVILIISFFYLLCFNYVYPYSQVEWIKSSITIVIIIQILSFLKCLLQSGLSFLSFKLNSEKLYKIGKLLD